MNKEQVLREVLSAILEKKLLGMNYLNCDGISPWCDNEVSKYVTTELDKLGYKLYAYHYEIDDKPSGKPSGLKITWGD